MDNNLTFQTERLSTVAREITPLLAEHFTEVAHFQDLSLDFDFEWYQTIERAGVLKVFTARYAGTLIGYSLFFVRPSLHRRNVIEAQEDLIFVKPGHRGVGHRLVAYSDRELLDFGVELIFRRTTLKNRYARTLKRVGYDLIDLVYAKRLQCRKDRLGE